MLMERIIINSNASYFAQSNNPNSINNESLLDKLKNCTLIVDNTLNPNSFSSNSVINKKF